MWSPFLFTSKAAMTDATPKRRPFQFSLRKLLLWTAVVALYLGVVKWAGANLPTAGEVTAGLVLVVSIRLAVGYVRSLVAAVAGPGILFAIAWLTGAYDDSLARLLRSFAWTVLTMLVSLTAVHIVIVLVNVADRLLERKPPSEEISRD